MGPYSETFFPIGTEELIYPEELDEVDGAVEC